MKDETSVPDAKATKQGRPVWESPTLEEVSDRVMAQPYIRFT